MQNLINSSDKTQGHLVESADTPTGSEIPDSETQDFDTPDIPDPDIQSA